MCNPAGSDEQRFLEASMAYVAGNPILSDKEFDQLKQRLKVDKFIHPGKPVKNEALLF